MHDMLAQTQRDWEIGQIFGLLFWSLLMLIGVIKCWGRARQPGVSRPCVMALALVLFGWMIRCLMVANGLWTPQATLVSTAVGVVAVAGLGLAAIVLAVQGLLLYDGKVHRHGRKHAVWAIVLALIFAGLCFISASNTYYEEKARGAAWIPSSAAGVKNGAYFENCSLVRPPHWVTELDTEKIASRSCIAFRRSEPEAYAMVIAEPLEDGVDLEICMQALKNNIDEAAQAIVEDKTTSLVIDGEPFLQRTCIAKMTEGPSALVYSELWVTAVPGYSWRILCWGPASDRELLAPQFKRIGESFRITDKEVRGPKPR